MQNTSEYIPLDQKYVDFFEWVKNNDGKFENIEVRQESSNMRGVFAKCDIKKDEILLFIPEKIIISLEKARNTPIGLKLQNQGVIPQDV